MDIRHWKPGLVIANGFEAKILVDVFRNAGVSDIGVFTDNSCALEELCFRPANILIVGVDQGVIDPLDWVRQLRRAEANPTRKAPVFMISKALTLALAERCRRAGANAIIGKPVSTATFLNTITKVLANPRPFIEAANYVGPCRRAGVVTAGAGKRRREADAAGR